MRLNINGTPVEASPEMTVKEAARKAGIDIPGLCDHPELVPFGGCRLCLVEIDGIRGYPSSCTTPVSEGMVVRTETTALRELRQTVLEMLLSEHPCICLTCTRAGQCDDIRAAMRKAPQSIGCRYCPADGRCELQRTVEQIGLKAVDLPHLGQGKEVVHSPFFDRDPNLCILCGRCIRACDDRGLSVISFTQRGFEARIGTAFDTPLEDLGCRFCGACVDVCPTGSLSERAGRWAGVPESIVVTTCPYCSDNCRIGLEVRDGKILRSRPQGDKLCVLGRFALEFASRDRLSGPLVRREGRLVETSWEEALSFAAKGLSESRKDLSALFTSGVMSSESLYVAWKLGKVAMDGRTVAPDIASHGFKIEDISSPVVVIGDISQTNPSSDLYLRALRPVVLSPFGSILARSASIWLRPRPGQEAQLITALCHAVRGSANGSGQIPAWEISAAAKELKGAFVVVGPDSDSSVLAASADLAKATGGRLCVLGRNCNSREAAFLGLNRGFQEAFKMLSSGSLSAAYIAGWNPARSNPDLANALCSLDILVVQDMFMTETAMLADVVLPAASFAEVDGSLLGCGGRAHLFKAAVQPVGRPDWKIMSDIGRMIGLEGFDFKDQTDIIKEMEAVDGADGIFISSPTPADTSAGDTMLVCSSNQLSFGSCSRTSRVFDLQYLTRNRYVEISPQDARRMSVGRGDPLTLESKRGEIRAAARISRDVMPGVMRISGTPSGVFEVRVRRDV